MKRFIRLYEEWLLAGIGIILFGAVIGLAAWTVENVSESMAAALATPSDSQSKLDFNIEGLLQLNLRGLSGGGN